MGIIRTLALANVNNKNYDYGFNNAEIREAVLNKQAFCSISLTQLLEKEGRQGKSALSKA